MQYRTRKIAVYTAVSSYNRKRSRRHISSASPNPRRPSHANKMAERLTDPPGQQHPFNPVPQHCHQLPTVCREMHQRESIAVRWSRGASEILTCTAPSPAAQQQVDPSMNWAVPALSKPVRQTKCPHHLRIHRHQPESGWALRVCFSNVARGESCFLRRTTRPVWHSPSNGCLVHRAVARVRTAVAGQLTVLPLELVVVRDL